MKPTSIIFLILAVIMTAAGVFALASLAVHECIDGKMLFALLQLDEILHRPRMVELGSESTEQNQCIDISGI